MPPPLGPTRPCALLLSLAACLASPSHGLPAAELPPYEFDPQVIAEQLSIVKKGDEEDLKMNNMGCAPWTSYYWPMASFWAEEVWRRQEAAIADEHGRLVGLYRFAYKAAFLTCAFRLDPRNGSVVSRPMAAYMRQAANAGADDYSVPKLPRELQSPTLIASDMCMWWVSHMWCDLGWWSRWPATCSSQSRCQRLGRQRTWGWHSSPVHAQLSCGNSGFLVDSRQLRGSKSLAGDVCWDTVDVPPYAFTVDKTVFVPGGKPADLSVDMMHHPEYERCLEHGLKATVLDSICPFAGRLPPSALGIRYWGDGIPAWGREEVQRCQATLGPAIHPRRAPASRDARFPSDPGLELV